MPEKKRVLFVCIENSCRTVRAANTGGTPVRDGSQMAEAFAYLVAQDLIQAFSAGSRPSGQINAKAVAVMAELGYDLGSHSSKSLSGIPQVKYDYVITMGCGDECPFIPAWHHEDWDLPDQKMLPLEQFRRVRDQIGERVRELAARIEVSNHAKR
jgi:protein-tyrosine-phosphatase